MQVLVKKTSVLSAETCTLFPNHTFLSVGGCRTKNKRMQYAFCASTEKLCPWDGIQTTSDITCDEPAVNISGKLSLQQVFTHYIYIYII